MPAPAGVLNVPPTRTAILPCIRKHFDRLLATGRDDYGPASTPMWMASLDTRTGRYPQPDARPESVGKRVYRNIDAPHGCSLYWDQPMLVAAAALTDETGDDRYRRAADDYVAAWLNRCVARDNGMLLWGNHYYYDAFRDSPMHFRGEEPPQPLAIDQADGSWHEMRPLMPAWEVLWRVDAAATERAIRAAAAGHLADPQTGAFNRHADNRIAHAFLEAGAIIIESLAWLYSKTGDDALLAPARAMARFSFDHRHPTTGLLENNPTHHRWDKHTATTEVGLWAGCLMRGAQYTRESDWQRMADAALSAWLAHGFDEQAGRYFGRLDVATGEPMLGPRPTLYAPGDHADLWRPLFPAHDYPMSMAEACLSLWHHTAAEHYRQACQRWLAMIDASLPARGGRGGYAEHYGRCLHFALRCQSELDDAPTRDGAGELAERLAREAMTCLWDLAMFRTHPGEHRYDAVDGGGYLILALLWHATGRRPRMLSLGW